MRTGKRLFDIAFSVLGLAVCSPLFVLIGLAIKLGDGGSVFFRQQRVGQHGKPFRMWKFRSMVKNAPALGSELTVGRDPRITRIGYLLRQTKLDELPQLINVLAGQMSFIGPRPEVAKYVALYNAEQRKVLELVPGITDPASIAYRNESELLAGSQDPERLYVEQIMPEKIQTNIEYAAGATFWSDLRVIALTFARLFAR